MIDCPTCGGETVVLETRSYKVGTRRRRRCASKSCSGRVTTYEVVVTPGSKLGSASQLGVMTLEDVDLIRALLDKISPLPIQNDDVDPDTKGT